MLDHKAKGIDDRSRVKIGLALEFGCLNSVDFLLKCSAKQCFSTSIQWFLFSLTDPDEIFQHLSKADLYIDAEVQVLADGGLYDVYNNGRPLGGALNVTLDRIVEHGTLGQSRHSGKPKYEHRRNMSDITMRVGTVTQIYPNLNDSMDKIMEHLESDRWRHLDHAVRMGFRLSKALHVTSGFQVKYVHYDRWTFNDSTGGILSGLIDREIDYSVTGLMTKIKRMEHLTSVASYMTFELMFIFKTPESSNLMNSAFIRPFSPSVWISVVLIVLLGSFVFKFNYMVEFKMLNMREGIESPSWYGLLVESLGNFCQQGSSFKPKSFSGKVVQISVLMCSVMVYNYYTSAIVSTLIGTPKKSDIKTLVQLANSHLELGIEDVTYEKAFFFESHLPDVDYLRSKKITDSTFIDSATGLQRIRKGNFAYNCERNVAYNLIRDTFDFTEVCDLNEVESMPTQFVDHVVRKDSHFRELFSLRYAQMREVGIVKKFAEFWIAKKPECFSGSIVSSVTIAGALPIFLLLGFGLTLATLLFGFELGVGALVGKLGEKQDVISLNENVGEFTTEKKMVEF
ncbi:glutamate receptor [Culex quinquefasciatus]|uniref:Glutamate receptor n=1 Tax=Culex quinquefasciatus TaxID=7176 RepID=B0WX51_CULQU|nr:glutamate receptor [Culex quinquefasciatus]|eukprot:XP_001861973.1 glutamate receptor [Culex quinquefasciatus]